MFNTQKLSISQSLQIQITSKVGHWRFFLWYWRLNPDPFASWLSVLSLNYILSPQGKFFYRQFYYGTQVSLKLTILLPQFPDLEITGVCQDSF